MKKHLYILWTNASYITAEHMIMMYAKNAILNDWWEKVTVIIWGEPQLLICENEKLRALIDEVKEVGVEFTACVACANNLGTKEKLAEYGFEVKPWGKLLTDVLQSDEKLITI